MAEKPYNVRRIRNGRLPYFIWDAWQPAVYALTFEDTDVRIVYGTQRAHDLADLMNTAYALGLTSGYIRGQFDPINK